MLKSVYENQIDIKNLQYVIYNVYFSFKVYLELITGAYFGVWSKGSHPNPPRSFCDMKSLPTFIFSKVQHVG